MPPIRIEPITLTPDKYRHEFKRKVTNVVLLFALWCPFGFGIASIMATGGRRGLGLPWGSPCCSPPWRSSPSCSRNGQDPASC